MQWQLIFISLKQYNFITIRYVNKINFVVLQIQTIVAKNFMIPFITPMYLISSLSLSTTDKYTRQLIYITLVSR